MGTITTLVSTNDCSATGTEVSARVIKRIGDGAISMPKEVPYWFVVPRDPRPDLKLFEYKTCVEAKAARDALGDDYMVLGPVVRKDRPKSLSREEMCSGTPVVETPIKTITLTFDDPKTEPVVLCAKEWDALFWGEASVDKFAIPYYVSVSGIEYGLRAYNMFHNTNVGCPTEEQSEQALPTAYAFVHEPDTDYTLFSLPGTALVTVPEELPL